MCVGSAGSPEKPGKVTLYQFHSDEDSDIDRPPLTEADLRRKINKQRSKIKPLPNEKIEEYKKINE